MITTLNQRWREHRDSYRPAGETIRTAAYEVAEISTDRVARAFVELHHYSGSYPAARWRFGLHRRGELVGVAVFSVPVNDRALTKWFPGAATDSTELGRFVLLDDVPANGETWFLGRCFEVLRREGLVGVRADSDPTRRTNAAGEEVFGGHIGNIYQAHNAVYAGRARPSTLFLLPDGRNVSPRALTKIRKHERGWRYAVRQLLEAGAPMPVRGEVGREWLLRALPAVTRTVRHPGNHVYLWPIARAARRELEKRVESHRVGELVRLGLPFPKLARAA